MCKSDKSARVWGYSATLFLAPEAYLYPWHWEKVPPDLVAFPVDERTLHIAWAESVGWPWPPPEVAEVELPGEVIASPEDRAIITSLHPGDTVRFDSVVVKGGSIHVEGARIVRPKSSRGSGGPTRRLCS